jgi:tetratricopeptide (TPR) repeat protein
MSPRSKVSRAQVYFHLGDYPKALSDCEQALNIEPEACQAQKFRELVRSYMHL